MFDIKYCNYQQIIRLISLILQNSTRRENLARFTNMKKSISIHQVASNYSPIKKLKLHQYLDRNQQQSTQPDKTNPAHKNNSPPRRPNIQTESASKHNFLQPHLQKINVQFYRFDQTILPYAYTTAKLKITGHRLLHQTKYVKQSLNLQKKIKSLNEAYYAQSVSSENDNQNPQIKSQSQIQNLGYYSPFQTNGRPFIFNFQQKKQMSNRYRKHGSQIEQTANFTPLMSHTSQEQNLMKVSLHKMSKNYRTSLVSSMINPSSVNQYNKSKNISESLVVFDYNRIAQENQFRISNLQKSQLDSKPNQINKDLINFFKKQKTNQLQRRQQQNQKNTCKTSQITQPNSVNLHSQNKMQYQQQKTTSNPYRSVNFSHRNKYSTKRIRIQTLQNQNEQNCLTNCTYIHRYNSADSKYRKLQSKASLQKQKKESKEKIRKQVKLTLSKNLFLQKDSVPNKLKLTNQKQERQNNVNQIQYKKHAELKSIHQNQNKSSFLQIQKDQNKSLHLSVQTIQKSKFQASIAYQTTNFSLIKNVGELKKLKKDWSTHQQK